jgi:hypothetical protein
LLTLSRASVGCYVGNVFVGALAYTDDIVLIALSPSAMHKSLNIYEDYANEYQILFYAYKSKCSMFSSKNQCYMSQYLSNGLFFVGNNLTECVQFYSHLGHIIKVNLLDDDDISNRHFNFIEELSKVLCYFTNLDSIIKHKFSSYCTICGGRTVVSLSLSFSLIRQLKTNEWHGGKAFEIFRPALYIYIYIFIIFIVHKVQYSTVQK